MDRDGLEPSQLAPMTGFGPVVAVGDLESTVRPNPNAVAWSVAYPWQASTGFVFSGLGRTSGDYLFLFASGTLCNEMTRLATGASFQPQALVKDSRSLCRRWRSRSGSQQSSTPPTTSAPNAAKPSPNSTPSPKHLPRHVRTSAKWASVGLSERCQAKKTSLDVESIRRRVCALQHSSV